MFYNDNFLSQQATIVDLGAGSGRDRCTFVNLDTLLPLDQCEPPIEFENNSISEGLKTVCGL